MRDVVIVVNPRAGSGRAVAVWERVRREVPQAEGARLVLADDPAVAAAQLDAALTADDPPARRLIAIGGDGTMHLAANRLVADGLADRVALGMVPGGTGSDLASTMGLPHDPAAALRRALEVEPRSMDLLRVETGGERRVVLNVASAGISGPVAQRVNAMAVRRPTVYLTEALRAVATFRPFRGRVIVDGEEFYDGAMYLLAVANAPVFGKGMKVAPKASVTDGQADVVVIKGMPRWAVPFRLPRLYLGNLLGSRAVIWRRGRRVRLEPRDPLPPLEVDGDTIAAHDTDFELLPRALHFLH